MRITTVPFLPVQAETVARPGRAASSRDGCIHGIQEGTAIGNAELEEGRGYPKVCTLLPQMEGGGPSERCALRSLSSPSSSIQWSSVVVITFPAFPSASPTHCTSLHQRSPAWLSPLWQFKSALLKHAHVADALERLRANPVGAQVRNHRHPLVDPVFPDMPYYDHCGHILFLILP